MQSYLLLLIVMSNKHLVHHPVMSALVYLSLAAVLLRLSSALLALQFIYLFLALEALPYNKCYACPLILNVS